jgi:endoglucanase
MARHGAAPAPAPAPAGGWRTLALVVVALAAVVAGLFWVAGCGGDTAPPAARASGHPTAPAPARAAQAPRGLYTDPANDLYTSVALLKETGREDEAAALDHIAATPSGIWASGQAGEFTDVRRAAQAAAKADEIPVIVAYNLPDRDACGKLSAVPSATGPAYERWIGQLAAAIGRADAIVVVEPDGLADIVRGCLSPAQASQRYTLLRYAMHTLGALPGARVYLDAGNPGMFSDPAPLAGPLREAGLADGQGFSANVSNFQWTDYVVGWSQQLERDLGGHYSAVVDTSRNGNGPYTGPQQPQWCNPPGRATGPAPTLEPHAVGIAAYLWIKNPWASDGPCHGGPPAGQVWVQYTLGLAQASTAASHGG